MGVTSYYAVNGEIIGENGPNGRIDHQMDALGSVVGTMNSSGSAQKVYRYKPYGAVLNDSGPGPEPLFRWVGTKGYRYSGRAQSDFYVRSRHYGSTAGGWNSVDRMWPIEPPYTYALDNPTSAADPTGDAGYQSVCSSPGRSCNLIPGKYPPCNNPPWGVTCTNDRPLQLRPIVFARPAAKRPWCHSSWNIASHSATIGK